MKDQYWRSNACWSVKDTLRRENTVCKARAPWSLLPGGHISQKQKSEHVTYSDGCLLCSSLIKEKKPIPSNKHWATLSPSVHSALVFSSARSLNLPVLSIVLMMGECLERLGQVHCLRSVHSACRWTVSCSVIVSPFHVSTVLCFKPYGHRHTFVTFS